MSFVGPEFEVQRIEVSKTKLDRIASDHLPLVVDIKIPLIAESQEVIE